MKALKEYRATARQQLKGNWGYAALFVFVYMVIVVGASTIISLITASNETLNLICSLIVSLCTVPMAYGLYVSFLELGRGKELKVGELFAHYNTRVFFTMMLQGVYTFLWTLLLIVPGIIKSFSYMMTPYILADYPELSYNQAIEKSMAMMKGNKMKLFLLILSFLGWIILSFLTLGIGIFWVSPYMYQSMAAFYEDLKAETAEA